jgi:RNA polymerase sigma-70 factor (ECF subfamily)
MEFQPKLVRFINGFVKDLETSKDITQNIFLKIWNNKELLAGVNSIDSYLFAMAKGAVFNYFDHEKVSLKYLNFIINSYEKTENGEERVFANELFEIIKKATNKMPRKRRTVFKLSREKGLSNKEISDKLNLSKKTVDNHIVAALNDIRKNLEMIIFIFFA